MFELSPNEELTLNKIESRLGRMQVVTTANGSEYRVVIAGDDMYILSKTGKMQGYRDVFRVLRALKWSRVLAVLVKGGNNV